MADWDKLDWQIKMADEAWQKFWRYTEICSGEVGCFGYATISEETKEVIVDTIFLFPQESDASQVDFCDKGLAYAIEKAVADDRLDDLKFCIHSHGSHGAFWSSTDDDMIKKMGLTTDWFASVVFNKKRDTVGRIDTWVNTPFGRCQWTVGNKLNVVSDSAIADHTQALAEIEEFVSKPAKVVYKAGSAKSNGHTATCPCKDCKALTEKEKQRATVKPGPQQQLPPGHETPAFEKQAWMDGSGSGEEFFPWTDLTDEIPKYEEVLEMMSEWQLAKVVAQSGHHYFYGDQGRTFLAFEPTDDGQLVFQPGPSRVAIGSWELAIDTPIHNETEASATEVTS